MHINNSMFFSFSSMLVEESQYFGPIKKNIVNKTKTRFLIFNLKLLPFLNYGKTLEFYLKLKDEFECYEFESFFEYFENTWIKLIENDNVKFD